MQEEAEFLIECGISNMKWTFTEISNPESLLCKSIVIYKNKEALDQFVEGLSVVGLLKYVKNNPASLKEIFCFEPFSLTAASFRKSLVINYSEPGSNRNNHAFVLFLSATV